LLGPVKYEALPALYNNAKAILFASSCENCPNILLESMGAGRPVLSSNVAPMPEFGGSSLIYFSPFDADDIRSAMQAVLLDENLAKRSADGAISQSALYDWSDTARRTWESIQQLMEVK